MTEEEAVEWVKRVHSGADLDRAELLRVFEALYGRAPYPREQDRLWAHVSEAVFG